MTDQNPLRRLIQEIDNQAPAEPTQQNLIATPEKPSPNGDGETELPSGMESFKYVLTATPMLNLFTRAADREHGHKKRGSSFATFKKDHKKFFWSCIYADYSLRFVATAALLAFVIKIGAKALA